MIGDFIVAIVMIGDISNVAGTATPLLTTTNEMNNIIEESFSALPQVHSFDGLLFDFDGTIVDSTEGK